MNTKATIKRISAAAIACASLFLATSSSHAATYRLTGDAAFTQGCFELCACPLWFSPMIGRFRLQPVTITGTYDTYAVTNVNWIVTATGEHITGHGTYTVFSEVAVLNRMQLDLVIGSNSPIHVDSGMVPAGVPFPRINVTTAEHGAPACYDTRPHINAKPIHADMNDDGLVNVDDLLTVINHWGACPKAPNSCEADIAPEPNGDGSVGVDDLLMVLSEWG